MLREPKSLYVGKRSGTLLKVKTFFDAEAKVVGYEPGKVRPVLLPLLEDETAQQRLVGQVQRYDGKLDL